MTERELEIAVEPFIQTFLTLYKFQVPISNRVMDCVGLDVNGQIIGIEFKLRHWKKAIEQAWKNKMSCDFLYVCMPNWSFAGKLCKLASQKGIGVILFNPKTNQSWIEIKPHKIKNNWQPNKKRIIEYMEAHNG